MKFKLLFAWYDFWVGIFYDQHSKVIYIFPFPMVGLMITLKVDPPKYRGNNDCPDCESEPCESCIITGRY